MDDLFSRVPPQPDRAFSGETYEPELDYERLNGQLSRVYRLMRDGQWRTLEQIAVAARGSPAAISARLRDFRKDKYGAHDVERRRVAGGLFEYRLIPRQRRAA